MSDNIITQILNFWFGDPTSPDYGQSKSFWFNSTPEIDHKIKDTFGKTYERALKGKLEDWKNTPEGTLALILLFDQFPRNMFRGTPQAFAMDGKALEVSKKSLKIGFDQECPVFQRKFMYLPFMHSENIEDQIKSVELFEELGEASGLDYAKRHYDIIAHFGRFPHRNAILNRQSTHDEIEFLKEPGSSF